MRNIILTIIFTVVGVFSSYGQLIPLAPITSMDVNNLTIKKISNSNSIDMFDRNQQLIQMFGSPTSSEPYIFEMEERVGTLYKYSGNEFYFTNRFYGFELVSGAFAIGNNNNFLKVGDSTSMISNFLPGYSPRGNDNIIYLKNGADYVSSVIFIESNSNVITKISWNHF
ncbi:hypothetical protein [Algoriphagus namhaensis]